MISFKEYLGENKKTTAEAKGMGLEHYGGGRWGKNGTTLFTTYYGTLIPFHGKSKKVIPEPELDQGKPPSNPKKPPKENHQHVYEDDELMVHTKALDHDAFDDTGKTRSEDPCLYNQVLHSIQMETGVSSRELMKKFNPVGRHGYGVSLQQAVEGFNGKEIDGKKLDVRVTDATNHLEDALTQVRNGNPVVCMVHTYGAIMVAMGNHGRLKSNMDKFQKAGGILKPAPGDGELNDKNADQYHALMLIGIDKKEGMAIFRDSQNDYAYDGSDMEYEDRKAGMSASEKKRFDQVHGHERKKRGGFLKIPLSYLEQNRKAILKFITINARLD